MNVEMDRFQAAPVIGLNIRGVAGRFKEPALAENAPLDGEGGKDEGKAKGGPGVALEEGHQEAETDEDHDVHVLEPGVITSQMLV